MEVYMLFALCLCVYTSFVEDIFQYEMSVGADQSAMGTINWPLHSFRTLISSCIIARQGALLYTDDVRKGAEKERHLRGCKGMLAEELTVLDVDSALWRAARPLLDAALLLEQNETSYSWYGWNKQQVDVFLKELPAKSSLVVGVWEVVAEEGAKAVHELLTLGVVCEVVEGEVHSVRTFEALSDVGLNASEQLEPGIEDALEIMRVVNAEVAPVAWALFTDKATWDEWLFAHGDDGGAMNKGELLASLARQGRCVLLGSQDRG